MRCKTQTANFKSGLRARVQRGFTFMELLIVMVIIAIMAAVAIPRFLKHLQRAKEVVLMQNLWTMRRAIDFYWQDKEKPPSNLQDLVSTGYLREIPKDPICSECQWNEVAAPAEENSAGGIGDVKSTAPGEDSNGKAFTDY
ncbi:MAG TPA: prepilin-type N-terminal cleavage/methylation domain-containing protein [Blastocatellia bacterium]|nr:prepilin-type N-terminal cleavage/methylation domain-containing protein [Blastocatellia bacterium]